DHGVSKLDQEVGDLVIVAVCLKGKRALVAMNRDHQEVGELLARAYAGDDATQVVLVDFVREISGLRSNLVCGAEQLQAIGGFVWGYPRAPHPGFGPPVADPIPHLPSPSPPSRPSPPLP